LVPGELSDVRVPLVLQELVPDQLLHVDLARGEALGLLEVGQVGPDEGTN